MLFKCRNSFSSKLWYCEYKKGCPIPQAYTCKGRILIQVLPLSNAYTKSNICIYSFCQILLLSAHACIHLYCYFFTKISAHLVLKRTWNNEYMH